MPICPQITNTPITVTYNSTDYTLDSVQDVQTTTTTFYASSAPNAQAVGDLWFDTSNGNKQYRWDGSSWVAVQDTAIASAYSLASTANSNATTATATANGKNVVTYSTSSYSGSGTRQGDIWFKYQSGTGVILAQWTWNGSSWDSTTLSDSVIASITAGKITAGTITVALGISNPSGNFTVDATTGKLTATGVDISGTLTSSAGTIGGFTINSGYLSYGGTYLNAGGGSGSGTYCIYDGTRGILLGGTANVGSIVVSTIYSWTSSGNITANGGSFSGVLGAASASITGTVSANLLTTGSGSYYLNNSGTLNAATSYITTANDTNLNISNTVSIGGGYGVTSSWSPNSDNTYNLGISGSLRWSHVYANNTTITTSDARLKTNIKASPLGLTFIEALNPVSYQWIEGSKKIVLDDQNQAIIIGEDASGKPIYKTESIPGTRIHYGLIAQEVKKVLDDANVGDFAGWVQDDINNPDSTQSLSYEQFISPLIKAVQELSNRLSKLEEKQ